MFPKCLNSSFTLYFHSQGFILPPPARHSGDPKQCAKIPFYCPGNGVVWGFRLFRCIPSKILSSAEIVVRWKAGPLLLLLQTKAEILMDFDFPDTSLGLDWYKQPKFTLRSVCLFVGCLFVLVWFGVFCVQTKSWAMSVLPTLNSHLFVFKNICFKDFWAEELAGSHRSCCWPGIWNASLWCVGGCCTQGTGNGDVVWIHYQAPLAVTLLQLLVNNFISELCLLTV